jgi:hypothetical protein
MDKQQILEIAKSDPRFSKAVLTLENQIGDMPITSEGLDELVQMLEFALNNPEQYPEIVASAVQDDMVEEGDLPAQFDPVIIISLLVLLYGMQERTKQQQGFAKGGLASMGRHGDTMLAHINPREAAMLKRMGGSGTINPRTGLPEYKFSLKKFLAVALPIALDFIVPGAGSAIGASMGFTGTAATMVGGAVIGGGTAALTGGDPLKGALLGGLGGGLGEYVGGAANTGLGLNLGTAGQNVLGNALVGGVSGVASGQGFLKGAATGALGTYAGQQLGDLTGNAAIGAGGKQFGRMITAGYDPKSAIIGGGLAGLASSMSRPAQTQSNVGLKPSDAVVEGLKMPKAADFSSYTDTPYFGTKNYLTGEMGYKGPDSSYVDYSLIKSDAPMTPSGYGAQDTGTGLKMPAQSPLGQLKTSGAGSDTGNMFSPKNVLMGATLLSSLSDAPPQVQQAVNKMSPAQQEYFNRPSVSWDWNKLQSDANANNLSLTEYMARSWPKITSGAYNMQTATTTPPKMAQGGALSAVARFAQGAGSGRADTIDAKLSDGEYVIDAETVAMLGDGSNKEGAKRLDAMRGKIRSHKGKVLARGKFSPNAKSPLSYLKGVA